MPNRILRESICTSPTIEGLTWFEEVCFYRLLVHCDDYGRMEARPAVLRSRLFPLREDVESTQVRDAVDRLAQVGLLDLYEVCGREFLELRTWNQYQRVRNKRSKYPLPPWAPEEEWQQAEEVF